MSSKRSVFVSKGRYRTVKDADFPSILIFEKIQGAVLVTELDENKGVVDQEYIPNGSVEKIMVERLGADVTVTSVPELERTRLSVACKTCGNALFRELEFVEPQYIKDPPTVPIFRCTACDKRFYSLPRAYLERLVDRKREFLEADELAELEKDRESTINTMNEYIIRIFASKKISRIEAQA